MKVKYDNTLIINLFKLGRKKKRNRKLNKSEEKFVILNNIFGGNEWKGVMVVSETQTPTGQEGWVKLARGLSPLCFFFFLSNNNNFIIVLLINSIIFILYPFSKYTKSTD